MSDHTNQNQLGQEKSPYLLQHKDNPVWWHSWGEPAFAKAREENKIIFLSVGYATCHWCHVMERESFEDQAVAKLLNDSFVAIKVDREEHPDVDEIYMSAIHLMNEHGGWPLNIFLTPQELTPFVGGTYFPKDRFILILDNIKRRWQESPDKIVESGKRITELLTADSSIKLKSSELNDDIFSNAYDLLASYFDSYYGGFGTEPKFPPNFDLQLLLRIYKRTGEQRALTMVTETLDKMLRGGIFDHLGGGFFRYSTDQYWVVPHFEKMLYDNASLATTYLEAYQTTNSKIYLEVATATLDYVLRAMTSNDGGFYSAEDADSEDTEGKFYVWTKKELKNILSEKQFELLKSIYNISSQGNFEDNYNILVLDEPSDWDKKNQPELKAIHQTLFEHRETRIHPLKDDKILTSWNGLMIAAMAKGYQVTSEQKYLEAAKKSVQFIKNNLFTDKILYRRWREGEKKYQGTLADYAYLISGLVSLYESSFDPDYLKWAEELQQTQANLFWDSEKGGYFNTPSEAQNLIIRSKNYRDQAIPSPNGVAALNLLKLASLLLKPELRQTAARLIASVGHPLRQYPQPFSQILIALDYYLDESKEVVVASLEKKDNELISKIHQSFIPNKVLAWTDGKTNYPDLVKDKPLKEKSTAHVCQQGSCQLPTTDPEEMIKQAKLAKNYKLIKN